MKNEIVIIMAAGLGTRMSELTERVPKPLVKVYGKPMIERTIEGFTKRGVEHIYVVVGYKKEQFEYLKEKYPNLSLIENKDYSEKNNISSVYAASDVLGSTNCFICEGDIYIHDDLILNANLNKSCYYGKMIAGYSDDWVFDMEGDRIKRIGLGGYNTYNMVGISYFLKDDAKIVAEAIKETYKREGHEKLYWDEVVNEQVNNIDLTIYPVESNKLVEIDYLKELAEVDSDYEKYNWVRKEGK